MSQGRGVVGVKEGTVGVQGRVLTTNMPSGQVEFCVQTVFLQDHGGKTFSGTVTCLA